MSAPRSQSTPWLARIPADEDIRPGQEWYDLDFPHVIELHRKVIGDERERYHLLARSVLDKAWLDTVSVHRLGNHPVGKRPFLFLAEGVFMYPSHCGWQRPRVGHTRPEGGRSA